MISEIESDLIGMLKSLGLDKDTTVSIVTLARTDENRLKLLQMMSDRYLERGEVTEQDVGKMLLLLTGKRKEPSATTSEKTEQTR